MSEVSQRDVERSLEHHVQSLDFNEKSVLISLKQGIWGGIMTGAGGLGTVEGIIFSDLRIIIPGVLAGGLGLLSIKNSIKDVREAIDDVAEDQASITVLKQELDKTD
ncbi:MAG TPA: hypothetical protein VLE51_02960 [Candidatus Saccharimonadales bacterium]|nr:hypothetical protein [Candidatus Saccharimonadales bacterium]